MSSRRRRLLAAGLLALCACARPARAQFLDVLPLPGAERDTAGYSVSAEPGGGGAPSILSREARGAYCVSSGSDTWTTHARAGVTTLGQTAIVIPQTGLAVPQKLWDLDVGESFSHQLGDRERWGASAGVGSASDVLFHSRHETNVSVSANAELPSGERNSWLLFLSYSTNRVFLNSVPLPGFAYVWRGDRFEAVAGFPFATARWRPDDDWTLSAGLFGGARWWLESERRAGPVRVYARLERQPRQWMPVNRQDYSDRLVFDEKLARLGARTPLGRGLLLDLSGGRAFGRAFYEGLDALRSNTPRATEPDCWVGMAQLSERF